MWFSSRKPRANRGKLGEVSDEKPREERGMRGEQAGERRTCGFWTQTKYHWAARHMQVKSLRAAGCYTTLTRAFTLSQGLGGWMGQGLKLGKGTRKEKHNTKLGLVLWEIMETIPVDAVSCTKCHFGSIQKAVINSGMLWGGTSRCGNCNSHANKSLPYKRI